MAHINLKVKVTADHNQKQPQKSPAIDNIKELRNEAKAAFIELKNSLNKFSHLAGLSDVETDPRLMKAFIDNTVEPGKSNFGKMEIELNNKTIVLPASVKGTYKISYIAKEIAAAGDEKLQKARIKPNVDQDEVEYHQKEMQQQLIAALQALSKGKEPTDKLDVTVDQANLDRIAEMVRNMNKKPNHHNVDDNIGHGLAHTVVNQDTAAKGK